MRVWPSGAIAGLLSFYFLIPKTTFFFCNHHPHPFSYHHIIIKNYHGNAKGEDENVGNLETLFPHFLTVFQTCTVQRRYIIIIIITVIGNSRQSARFSQRATESYGYALPPIILSVIIIIMLMKVIIVIVTV